MKYDTLRSINQKMMSALPRIKSLYLTVRLCVNISSFKLVTSVVYYSAKQLSMYLVDQTANQPPNRSIVHLVNNSFSHVANQPIIYSTLHSISRSISHLVIQSCIRDAIQPSAQLVSPFYHFYHFSAHSCSALVCF